MKQDKNHAVISGMSVIVESTPVSVGEDGSCIPPRVKAIRSGETVTAIEITCSCGKQIALDCVYDSAD